MNTFLLCLFLKFQGSCSQALCLCCKGASQPPGAFAESPSAPSSERRPAGFLEDKGRESPDTTCASWEPLCARARRSLCSHGGGGWETDGRTQEKAGRGIRRHNKKRRIKVQREHKQWKKWEGGWKDVRGNGNKQVQVSTISGLCCLFLHISTLMLLCPAQERERQHAECHRQQLEGVQRMWGGWNTQVPFFPTPATSSVRKARMLNLHYLHCFNFTLYEPLCLWRTVKQNEEGNQTWKIPKWEKITFTILMKTSFL